MKQCRDQMSMFSAEASRDCVSRFQSQDTNEERKMTVTSGQRCLELYRNSDRLGCLVRMCLESSIWHSTRCLLTWKTSATPDKRLLFRLAVSMPRTSETELLFWPTPSTGAALCGGTGNFKTLKKMAEKGLITEEERRQLSQGNGGRTNPQLLEWLMGYEQKFTELIPTPRASDYKGAPANRWYSRNVHVERERERERERQIPGAAGRISGMHSAWEDWPHEPGLDRVVDWVPNRMDRLKCLGNSVVPQQFYPFFAFIAEIELNKGDDTNAKIM